MLIYCKKEFREIYVDNTLYYCNRVVNLDYVSVLGTNAVKRDGIHTFYTIRFSHSKSNSTEWYFINKENRDKVYESILAKYVEIM